MSAITYLRLDANHDPIFDPDAELSNLDAVAQAIDTRLLLFQGEWWENLSEGTPMFQGIIGNRASQSGLEVMSLAISSRIAGTPYVSAVENISITFNPTNRKLTFSAIAQTSFGSVPVTFTPGAVASLG